MIKKQKSTKELPSGCLTLFGLPFMLAGLFMAGFYFWTITQWINGQTWVETACWIDTTELKTNSDGDGSTYQATASYHYDFKHITHHGTKVSFHEGSDNVGNFHQDAYNELSTYLHQPGDASPQRAFHCYVNPQKPDQAVLYRNLRWEMQAFIAIFALTFPAVGAALVIGGLVYGSRQRIEKTLKASYPDEPWKWKAQWADPTIISNSSKSHIAIHTYTLWSAAIIFSLVGCMVISGAYETHQSAWLTMIFVVLWLIPAGFSIRCIRHRIMAGTIRFEPKQLPFRIGELMEGNILIKRPPPLHHPIEISLICNKATTVETHDGHSTQSDKVVELTDTISADEISRGFDAYQIPIRFDIPNDAPLSGESDENSSIKYSWELTCKVAGTAIDEKFELPVFGKE